MRGIRGLWYSIQPPKALQRWILPQAMPPRSSKLSPNMASKPQTPYPTSNGPPSSKIGSDYTS